MLSRSNFVTEKFENMQPFKGNEYVLSLGGEVMKWQVGTG